MSYADRRINERRSRDIDIRLPQEYKVEYSKIKLLIKNYGPHGISAVLDNYAREQIKGESREIIYQMSKDLREALKEESRK